MALVNILYLVLLACQVVIFVGESCACCCVPCCTCDESQALFTPFVDPLMPCLPFGRRTDQQTGQPVDRPPKTFFRQLITMHDTKPLANHKTTQTANRQNAKPTICGQSNNPSNPNQPRTQFTNQTTKFKLLNLPTNQRIYNSQSKQQNKEFGILITLPLERAHYCVRSMA